MARAHSKRRKLEGLQWKLKIFMLMEGSVQPGASESNVGVGVELEGSEIEFEFQLFPVLKDRPRWKEQLQMWNEAHNTAGDYFWFLMQKWLRFMAVALLFYRDPL